MVHTISKECVAVEGTSDKVEATVQLNLGILEKAIEDQQDTIGKLFSELEPVLYPNRTDNLMEDSKPSQASPMALRIDKIVNDIQYNTRNLQELIKFVEL